MVAVEGADDMRNLLMVNHVWLAYLQLVSASGHLAPLSSKRRKEKRINRSGFSTTGHEGKINYIYKIL